MNEASHRSLSDRVEAAREELVELCRDLVSAPSENPPGDTRAVADIVAGYLQRRGLAVRLEREVETMPSVVADLDTGRPGPHLVLNVHLDTMPPGPIDDWSVPVHELTRRGGRLYGLGMGNMKGAVAAMAFATTHLAERMEDWSGRLTFTAVADEVVFGDHGSAFLLRRHPELYADALLCGEGPGFQRIATAEKGVLWLQLEVRTPGGHASSVRPRSSAAALMARAVTRIDELSGRRIEPPPRLGITAEPDDPGSQLTCNVGVLSAGSFIGQVPTSAVAEVDVRLPPGCSADEIQAEIEERLADLGVSVRRLKGWDANGTDVDDPFVRLFSDHVRRVQGHEPRYAVRLPASDASRWRRRAVPSICYGPQPTLSAGVDDHAEEQEVLDCAVLYGGTALDFLSPAAPHR